MRGAVARPRPIEALGYYANSIVVCMFIRKLHDFLNIEQEQFARKTNSKAITKACASSVLVLLGYKCQPNREGCITTQPGKRVGERV